MSNPHTAQAVIWFGLEDTFETAPSAPAPDPLIIESGSFAPDFSPEMLKNEDGSARQMDEKKPIEAMFKGGAKFATKSRPHAAQITAAAPSGTVPAQLQLLKMIFGGMKVGAGSAITAGTANSVTLTSAAGFEIGQPIGLAGNGTMHVAIVTGIAANVVSFYPSLGTPVTSGTAINGYTFFLTENNTLSGTFRGAYVDDANAQYEFRGCIGKAGFKQELGKLMMLEFELEASAGDRGALGFSTAVQSQTMADGGVAAFNAMCLLQPTATTTRNNIDFEEWGLDLDPTREHLPSHAGRNGRRGAWRKGMRSPVTKKITVPWDISYDTAWRTGAEQQFLYVAYVGSGTTRRAVGMHAPRVVIDKAPVDKDQGGRRVMELSLITLIDPSAAVDSLAGSPFKYFTL